MFLFNLLWYFFSLPEDNRNVVYGVIRDCYHEPVCDAVVKLIEIVCDDRRPVSHTFTNKDGEFVFGPLCPDKQYEIVFWVDNVKHKKICVDCKHQGSCLKGIKLDCDKKFGPKCDKKEDNCCS